MVDFVRSSALLLVLLNPFLVILYLIDAVQKLERAKFRKVLVQAGIIALVVFAFFAALGDAVFSSLIQAEFASFQIFGGVIFLLIAVKFVFQGPAAIEMLKGDSEHLAGAIAMPVLIGPGTISASVVIGKRLSIWEACIAVAAAVAASVAIMILLKSVHDYVKPRREFLIERYAEIAGRILALYVGTVSIEMIMQGASIWIGKM